MRNPLSIPIIKPVNGACNLGCHYCYMLSILEPQKSNCDVMSREVLHATIDFFCSHQDNVEFTWHGGEPLLAGMEFYRDVSRLQKSWSSRGKRISNFIQTNGTLIDDEWAELFKEIGFFVGVSLDAPADVHDKLRTFTCGASSLSYVLRGIPKLIKNDIFNGVICCVGKSNFNRPREVLDFFLGQGVKSIKFLRTKGEESETISASQYADFLFRIFNLWIEIDDPDIEIRDIKSIVDILLGGEYRECTFTGRCDQFATVYSDGSIFPCDRFLNEPRLQFGTVLEPYAKVLSGENFQAFLAGIQTTKEPCRGCRRLSLCNGGCLKERLSNEREDICQASQKLFEEIESALKRYGLSV